MSLVQESIEVNVDVESAYCQWTRFEEFPLFMKGIEEVRRMGPGRLYWRDATCRQREWFARILERLPNTRISWYCEGDAELGGEVAFRELAFGRTLVSVTIAYEPELLAGDASGDHAAVVSARLRGDLRRFRRFMEGRLAAAATGMRALRGSEESAKMSV